MDANPTQVTKERLGLVYAWNEAGKGGWLVPCRDGPDGAYLKTIRRVVLVNNRLSEIRFSSFARSHWLRSPSVTAITFGDETSEYLKRTATVSSCMPPRCIRLAIATNGYKVGVDQRVF